MHNKEIIHCLHIKIMNNYYDWQQIAIEKAGDSVKWVIFDKRSLRWISTSDLSNACSTTLVIYSKAAIFFIGYWS